jgi:hypothetical protein
MGIMDPAQMTGRRCFQCETENPLEQPFCGNCGAALVLSEYISGQVSKELANAIRDRDILETESAIRVFERAWGWANLVMRILGVALALVVAVILTLAGWVGWKEFDLVKTADNAKQSIEGTATKSIGEINTASNQAIDATRTFSTNTVQLSNDVQKSATQTKAELRSEATSVRSDVAKSESELEAVKKLQPEFDSMRAQLGKATSELAAQQKVISSSEEFVKHVFSTHITYMFAFTIYNPNVVVIPAPQGAKNSIVYMLVPDTPIDGTMQLQWGVFVQPPGSYIHIHNLILFFWGDPPEELKNNTLAVSFFPDKSDKETIKALTVRDGRVYADDQPLPKFGQPDPDFRGNKWMTVQGQPVKQ